MHLNVNNDYVRNYMLSLRQFMICGTRLQSHVKAPRVISLAKLFYLF